MTSICGCRGVEEIRKPDYSASKSDSANPARTTPDALAGSYQGRSCISGHSCENAYYAYANTTSASRIQQLSGLLERFRCFSPAELELAWMISQFNSDHRHDYSATAGPAYLAGAVLASFAHRQFNWPYASIAASAYQELRVSPIGSRIDVRM